MEENTIAVALNPDAAEARAEASREITWEEIAKLVEQAVERRLAGLRKEFEERAAQVRAETERLASMSEPERLDYAAEAARQREEQLARREAELNRRELRAWAVDALQARGLPRELETLVNCADMESCAAGVDALEKVFREAVQRGVDERIRRGRSLPRSDGGAQGGMTRRMRMAAGLGE